MAEATAGAGDDPGERMRAGIRAFLQQLASHGNESQTLLVEIIGAGPRASERRDAILQTFADALYEEAEHAARRGQGKGFASHDDAFAVIAAGAELASRHVRLGTPADATELEPVLERVLLGALSQAQ
jgi:hypothetical protein